MRVLVTAASKHGATAGIARSIGDGLRERGLAAEALPLEEVESLDGFDAVVLGSAVYYGHWLEQARAFVRDHALELAERPVWLFSSGPVGPPGHTLPKEDALDVQADIEATHAVAHRVFAGRVDRSELGLGERLVTGALKAQQGDFRDWPAIDGFAAEIAASLNGAA